MRELLTGAQYALGALATVAVVAALVVASVSLRRATLPDWRGAPARLVESVAALALFIGVPELAGAFGSFRPGIVFVSYLVAAAVVTLVARRAARPATPASVPAATDADADATAPLPGQLRHLDRWAGITAVALVTAQWTGATVNALRHGMWHPDTVIYHGPFTARFLETGRFGELTGLAEPSQRYYAYNSEVVHGVVTMPFRTDVLEPLTGLVWLALTALAAWCIGRRFGMPGATTTGAMVVMALPALAATQPGQASNDGMCAAFLLAAVALLLLGAQRRPAVAAFAGTAAGLALSTKLTAVVPIVVFSVTLVVLAVRARRAGSVLAWLGTVIVFGGTWFLRSWVLVDNPFPYRRFSLGPVDLPATVTVAGESVSSYLTNGDVWRDWFLPGLSSAFTNLWPVVLAVAVVSAFLLALRRREALVRMVGVAALLGLASYVVQPLTADGGGSAFPYTLRYATPSLLLAFSAAPIAFARQARARAALVVGFLVLLGVSLVSAHEERTPAWPTDGRVVGVLAGVLVFVVLAFLVQGTAWRASPTVALGVVGALLAGVAFGGWFVQRQYVDRRYVATGLPSGPADEYFRTTRGLRVAAFGGNEIFGMFGAAMTNDVRKMESMPGRNTCEHWRRALAGYDHIAIVPGYGLHYLPPRAWFTNEPGVRVELREGTNAVLRVDGPLPASGCPST